MTVGELIAMLHEQPIDAPVKLDTSTFGDDVNDAPLDARDVSLDEDLDGAPVVWILT